RLEPRPVPASSIVQVPPAGASAWNAGRDVSPMSIMYASIDASPEAAPGMAFYANHQNGAIVSETSVAAAVPVREGRIYAEVDGPVKTGIAIANPGDVDADISFHFADTGGRSFGFGNVTVPAHHQLAAFLNERPFQSGFLTAPS